MYIFNFTKAIATDRIVSHILQILQLQMNDYKYHYLFTTFVSTLGILKRTVKIHLVRDSIRSLACPQDIETFDLEDFKYNFVNITAFRLVDADDVGVRSILRDMERYQPSGNTILNKSRIIQVSTHESSVCGNACTTRIREDNKRLRVSIL